MAVYLIQGEDGGNVKIGYARCNPWRRLQFFQAHSPVRLVILAVMVGSRKRTEFPLHRKYTQKGFHKWYEWFALPVDELVHLIKMMDDNPYWLWFLDRKRHELLKLIDGFVLLKASLLSSQINNECLDLQKEIRAIERDKIKYIPTCLLNIQVRVNSFRQRISALDLPKDLPSCLNDFVDQVQDHIDTIWKLASKQEPDLFPKSILDVVPTRKSQW